MIKNNVGLLHARYTLFENFLSRVLRHCTASNLKHVTIRITLRAVMPDRPLLIFDTIRMVMRCEHSLSVS